MIPKSTSMYFLEAYNHASRALNINKEYEIPPSAFIQNCLWSQAPDGKLLIFLKRYRQWLGEENTARTSGPRAKNTGISNMVKKLLDKVIDEIKLRKGKYISIGIIDENIRLKKWYLNYGFIEKGTRRFEHLPFIVCFMGINL